MRVGGVYEHSIISTAANILRVTLIDEVMKRESFDGHHHCRSDISVYPYIHLFSLSYPFCFSHSPWRKSSIARRLNERSSSHPTPPVRRWLLGSTKPASNIIHKLRNINCESYRRVPQFSPLVQNSRKIER